MPVPPAIAHALAARLLSEEDLAYMEGLNFQDAGHGFDPFGMHPSFLALGAAVTKPLYERYFRVMSYGHENIPKDGQALLAINHSGTIPVDGMMVWADVVRKTGRIPRAVADHFVPTLPFVGVLFARSGMIGGSRGNVRALLSSGELLMIFPEGTPGIGKHFRDRYQLQKWRVGHAELSIRHSAPIVPVAVIGAEEQMPQIAQIKLPKFMASAVPYLPVPLTPLPMPVRYRIFYGEPIRVDQEYSPADADDPEKVRAAAARVKAAVQDLIDEGLRLRGGRLFT